MRMIRWVCSILAIVFVVAFIVLWDFPIMTKFLLPLILAAFLVLYRIIKGPTAADRAVAADVLGILVIGICAIFTIFTKKGWYMDLAIAWALQSFIGTLALAKYLEGRDFDS